MVYHPEGSSLVGKRKQGINNKLPHGIPSVGEKVTSNRWALTMFYSRLCWIREMKDYERIRPSEGKVVPVLIKAPRYEDVWGVHGSTWK